MFLYNLGGQCASALLRHYDIRLLQQKTIRYRPYRSRPKQSRLLFKGRRETLELANSVLLIGWNTKRTQNFDIFRHQRSRGSSGQLGSQLSRAISRQYVTSWFHAPTNPLIGGYVEWLCDGPTCLCFSVVPVCTSSDAIVIVSRQTLVRRPGRQNMRSILNHANMTKRRHSVPVCLESTRIF